VTRIYTRTGDNGTTGLIGGKRVSKDSPLIETNGSLDELNALIGVVRSNPLPTSVDRVLQRIQEDIFVMGAEIATPEKATRKSPEIGDADIKNLEHEIDVLENDLLPLKNFILPGGAKAAAELHLARAVARRAERECVAQSRLAKISPLVLSYLNRLSDLFFVLARYVNQNQNVAELHPAPERFRD
jgi:cob(I)alamin adenosyltransferase